MADTTQTIRRGFLHGHAVHREKYLGVAAMTALVVAIVVLIDSPGAVWQDTVKVLKAIALLAQVVIG